MSSTAALDIASASVKLLPSSVAHQLLLSLGEKDANLRLLLITLATPYQDDSHHQQHKGITEERLESALSRFQQLERDLRKLSYHDGKQRRMLLLQDVAETISNTGIAEVFKGRSCLRSREPALRNASSGWGVF